MIIITFYQIILQAEILNNLGLSQKELFKLDEAEITFS